MNEINGLNLKVGGRYVRRNGTVTPPLTIHESGRYEFLHDTQTEFLFGNTEDGNFVFDKLFAHPCDLLQEYVE